MCSHISCTDPRSWPTKALPMGRCLDFFSGGGSLKKTQKNLFSLHLQSERPSKHRTSLHPGLHDGSKWGKVEDNSFCAISGSTLTALQTWAQRQLQQYLLWMIRVVEMEKAQKSPWYQLHNKGKVLPIELSTSNEQAYKDSSLVLNWYSYQHPNQSY